MMLDLARNIFLFISLWILWMHMHMSPDAIISVHYLLALWPISGCAPVLYDWQTAHHLLTVWEWGTVAGYNRAVTQRDWRTVGTGGQGAVWLDSDGMGWGTWGNGVDLYVCHSTDPVASQTGSTLTDEWRDHGNEKLRGGGGAGI